MSNANKILRDFLYLDVDRLYSLSSQMFEGAASHIVESFLSEQKKAEPRRGTGLWPKVSANLGENVAEAALRVENRVVHDHLYNQLEKSLADIIQEPINIDANNFREELAGSFLIKVRGRAVIDDYARLSTYLATFNALGASIAYITKFKTGEFEAARADLEAKKVELKTRLQASKNPLEKTQIKGQLEAVEQLEQPMEFLRAFAADLNLQQDPTFVASLNIILEMFRPNAYEMNISPPNQDVPISFRGVVDKQWLRADPEHLRNLYGGSSLPTDIVMVGQITYMPAPESDSLTAAAESPPEGTDSEQSMKDISHNMFRIMSTMDEMMTASKQRIEMLVRPLAIYQEIAVPSPIETS